MLYGILLFSIKLSLKKPLIVCPGGFTNLDDGLHQINQSLMFFCEGGSMIFTVYEVCGDKGPGDECLPSFLFLTVLVIIHST
jgi:hypothetical protein